MRLRGSLSRAGGRVREFMRSRGRDGYSQYKWDRNHEVDQANRAREHAAQSDERARQKTERENAFEERYDRERETGGRT
jgi:hypothetical protein